MGVGFEAGFYVVIVGYCLVFQALHLLLSSCSFSMSTM